MQPPSSSPHRRRAGSRRQSARYQTRRPLYALQVASANAKHLSLPPSAFAPSPYTNDGLPLAPQEYGWDLEDIEEEIDREDQEEEEEEA